MSALGSLVVKLALEHAEYTQGIDKSSQQALKFAQNAQRSFDQASSSVKDFMKGAVAQAAAAVGAMVAVNESFARSLEFSKSIAQISTQIDGSIDDLNRLEAAARSMSAQYGTLPVDQSRAFYEIISSGTSDVTKATELLSAANKLAIGGNTDLATSVDGLTNIMNSYSGKVEGVDAVSDALFVGMKAGKATMEELSSGLGKVTPIAATLNVSFDELVATVAALSLQGISTGESITGVRAILASIAKPTKEAEDLASGLGLQFDSAGLQAKGFAGFLEDVSHKTGGNVDKLALLFGGVEALIPIMALSGQAGKDFSQIMGDMGSKAGSTQDAFEKMAASPGFKIDQLMASINNIAITLGDSLASVLAPAAEKASRAINQLFGVNKNLSEIDKQKQKIKEFQSELESLNNRKHIPLIGDWIFDKPQADLLEQRIEDGIADLKKLEAAQVEDGGIKKTIDFSLNMPKVQDAATRSIKQTADASRQFIERLQQEAAQVGKTTLEIRKMEAAKLGLSKQADPLIDKIDQETRAEKELQDQLSRVKSITDSVATEQEIYNAKLAELETLKPHLGLETYERALKRLKGETTGTVSVTRTTTDEVSQLWMQAGRNIQSILSNSIFDFFSDGLDGMWRNAKSAIGRILSEFAALKLAQGIGLSSMFAIPGSAMASGGTGGTGIGASSFDIASLSMNAVGLVKSGFGLNSLIGGGMSAIGGSGLLGSFGAGMSGGSAAASFIAAESATAGAGLAAGMGSAFAAAAGPLMIAAAATAGLKALAGDKRLGGGFGNVMNTIGDIPIIGDLLPVIPLINGLFGRGPLKQKGTTLSGSVGSEGFTSGSMQTDFVAKGGLFRSDKNDFARVDAVTGAVSTDNDKLQSFADQLAKSSKDIIGLINDTTTQVSTSLRMVGRDLGLSVDSIDSFSRSIELVSEKGKLLTDEQIASEISAITDELARGLIPEVDSLSKRGESAIQTVNRLGIEFNAIVDSAVVILDKTIAESKKLVQSISFEDRTEFVDAAGGVDALSQKVSFFAQNFLTEAERLAPAQEKVTEELNRLGLSSTLTRDQFRDLVQSYGQVNGITEDTLQALLNLAPAFVSVTKAAEDATETAKQQASVALNDAFSVLQKSVDAERKKITDDYNDALKAVNDRIQHVSDSIGKLKTLSDALKSTVDALRPMSRQQAKDQIQQAIDAARSGKALPDAKDLQQALGVLGNKSTSGFTSSFEFAREQAKTANLIGELGGLTDSQLTVEERSLSALEAQRDRLDQGFRDEIGRLDTLLEQGKAQIDSINGLNTSVVSLIDALGQLNLRLLQGGGSGVIDPTTGGAPVGGTNEERGQLINQFINAPGRTPEEIYAASVKYGVTAEELDSQSKFSLKEINDWIDSKGLKRLTGVPGFASGGMHRGGLRIVGERGPELESTGPSRITSNSDLKSIVNNDGVVKAISELQAEISEVKTSNNKVRKILDAVTQGGSYLRVKNIL